MNRFLIVLLVIGGLGCALWFLGPRERTSGSSAFDASQIGPDIDAYLFRSERGVPDLVRGAQKHVLWADPVAKSKTPLSLVYVHGFSATLEEVRPVPDDIARTLGANLFYTRLKGHGRNGAAMGEARYLDWRDDLIEAVEIGRRIGEKVILIGTSTGGSLITKGLTEAATTADVAGVILLSPNFEVQAQGAALLNWPFARNFVPLVLGEQRFFAPENTEHGKWWTTRYPTRALIPMAATVKVANDLDHSRITTPALFLFSDADQVVRAERTRAVAAAWGGPVSLWPLEAGPNDDRQSHVIAGKILSPDLSSEVVKRILEWVRERGLAR
ncbi:MAG: alpha/beta fold hydrolase [Pseudomonadota bacterium]